jgi:hypothetical protein
MESQSFQTHGQKRSEVLKKFRIYAFDDQNKMQKTL